MTMRAQKHLFVVGSFLSLLALPFLLHAGCSAAATSLAPTPISIERERVAVAKVLPLLQQSARNWFEYRTCVSCHHQTLGLLAIEVARSRNFSVDSAMAAEQVEHLQQAMVRKTPEVLQGTADINGQIGQPYKLLGLAAAGAAPNAETDVRVHFLLGKQQADGRWRSESHRPPLEDNDVTATALSVRAIQSYAPPGRAVEIAQRLERAHGWLAKLTTRSTEERTMQLLGLAWSGGSTAEIGKARKTLLREQRADGGWAQLPTLSSDAYATGEVLVALQQLGGLAATDPTYRRGIEFLLSTQHADGSWLVSTRRRGPGLPYFETGFPHGEDQFISYAGTCWATLALCFSIDPVASPVFSRPEPHATRDARDTTELTPFLRAVLFDGAEAVKAQIAAGADVHAKGPGGVTALMCAAGDVDKTRVLLEHGAAVDVRSELGYTALIVAAGWNGGREVSLLLLEHGADVQARASDGMTALSRAVLAGDGVLTERLLAAGANLEPAEDTDLGPLACATEQGDAALVRELLARGAKYGGYPGDPSIGYLTGAVNDGLNDTVKALLAGGATVDEKDETGFTPLHWAAAVDFGDTEILELLLAKGADINARTSDQSTPLKLAMKYGNKRQEEILRQAGARE